MTKPKRWVLAGGVFLFFVAVITAGYIGLHPPPVKPVTIGVISPLTGSASHLADVGLGVRMAVEELNKWGGLGGRSVQVIVVDSRTKPEGGKAAFKLLEEKYRPDLYISISSLVSMAVAPMAEEYQVPLVGLAVSAAGFTRISPWLFRYHISADEEAQGAVKHLRRQHIKSAGVLFQADQYGRDVKDAFLSRFEKTGGTAWSAGFDAHHLDGLDNTLNPFMNHKAIYIVGFRLNLTTVCNRLKEKGYTGLLVLSSAANPNDDTEGAYTVAPIVYSRQNHGANRLREQFETRENRPFNHYVAGGYDFIRLLSGLMEERELSRESLRDALTGGFSHNGLFGSFRVKPGVQNIYYPLFPVRIRDGRLMFL